MACEKLKMPSTLKYRFNVGNVEIQRIWCLEKHIMPAFYSGDWVALATKPQYLCS